MKMKAVVLGVLSGLLATSIAGFTPAYADDEEMMSPSDGMQLAENDNQGSAMMQDDMGKSCAKKDDADSGDDASSDDASGNDSSSNDEATPDMATGDDDY